MQHLFVHQSTFRPEITFQIYSFAILKRTVSSRHAMWKCLSSFAAALILFFIRCLLTVNPKLQNIVSKYAEFNNIKNTFDQRSKIAGLDWIRLIFYETQSVSLNRNSAFNKKEITHFYDRLRNIMETHKFIPINIYNANKTGNHDDRPGKVLTEKRRVCDECNPKLHTTQVYCFQTENDAALQEDELVFYTNFKSCWKKEDIFVTWFKHFAAFAKLTQESVLLIRDNNSSHISLQVINF